MGNLNQQDWDKLINQFEDSELSLEAYCKQNKIKKSTFYFWKRKIKQEDKEVNRNDFLEIKQKESFMGNNKSQLKIYLPSGVTFNFYSLPDCDYLEKLMKKIGGLP